MYKSRNKHENYVNQIINRVNLKPYTLPWLCTLVSFPRGLTPATKFLQQKDFLRRPLQLLSVKPRGGELKYTTTVIAKHDHVVLDDFLLIFSRWMKPIKITKFNEKQNFNKFMQLLLYILKPKKFSLSNMEKKHKNMSLLESDIILFLHY
eukprot:UN22656